MKSSPSGGLEVFDFKEDDELAETASGKYLLKFKSPRGDSPPSLKHDSPECGMFSHFCRILILVS